MGWICRRRCLAVLLWTVPFLLGLVPETIASDDDNNNNAVGPTAALEADGKPSNQTSTIGARVASLSAAELTTLCFGPTLDEGNDGKADDVAVEFDAPNEDSTSPLFNDTMARLELERVEDAAEDVDIKTLAGYTSREAFLNPSKPANSTLVVPLAEDILACAPDPGVAVSSLEVLSACQTKPSGNPDEDVVFLIQWGATFVCTNSVLVLRGSELDVSMGSVLVLSSTEPSISIEKLFVSSL